MSECAQRPTGDSESESTHFWRGHAGASRRRNGFRWQPARGSINVEFSNELLIEVTSPVLDGGEFPEISRPFDWEVTASSPAGITGVSFLVDGVEIATDREGPVYSARIDPLLYNGMPSDLCGDEFEHNLSIVVTDGNGEQFTGAGAQLGDSTPPLIRLTNPAVELDGSAGLITRSADGTRFNIEMELEDNDDQPSVAVEVNDAVVGQQDTPPYQVGSGSRTVA